VRFDELTQQRFDRRQYALFLGQENDSDRSPHTNPKGRGAMPGHPVVYNGFVGGMETCPRDYFRLAFAQIPGQNQGWNFFQSANKRGSPSVYPISGGVIGRPSIQFLSYPLRNNQIGTHPFEQIDTGDPSKSDERRGVYDPFSTHAPIPPRVRPLFLGKEKRGTVKEPPENALGLHLQVQRP